MKRRVLVQTAGASAMVLFPGLNISALGAEKDPIAIGRSAVLSGMIGAQSQAYTDGAELAFQMVNRKGGIAGRPIKLISLDDGLVPGRTVSNCEKLIVGERVTALIGLVGSANLIAVEPLLRQRGVPVVGAIGVSDSARAATRDTAYFVRAGYGREMEKIVQQVTTIGVRRIALAYAANPGGEEVKTVFLNSLQRLGINPGVAVAASNDGGNVADCAAAIAAGQPQVVVLGSGGSIPAKIIEALNNRAVFPSYYGMSVVPGEATAQALGSKLRSLVISQVVPYPWANDDPPIQAFRTQAGAASVTVNYTSFEGYINALLLAEVLKRCGGDLSPSKLHMTLRQFKGRIGGMNIDFAGDSNTGSKFVELVYLSGTGKFTR
jgi:branched-chain amino acid transport system substrate-binding protein